jgi:hypothetical protein
MVMGHPYNACSTLIDYSTMAILTPAMLVGIKAGARALRHQPAGQTAAACMPHF